MFGERLHRARKAAGLSMSALASQVGVSANAIKKYEHGENMPSSGKLLKMAKALGVRTEYFFRPVKVEISGIEYRKRASTPQKTLDRINGDVWEQAERWAELIDLYPDTDTPVPAFMLPSTLPKQINGYEQLENIAKEMRQAWQLGQNPIPDLVDTLESKGIMVITTKVEVNAKFDGLAGNMGNTPLIVISHHQPGDRQRFTLSHELGHLVVHGRLDPKLDEEKACNRFAGAFLFPNDAVKQHLGNRRNAIELQELYMLKHEFGLSMAGILHRALHCDIINDYRYKSYAIGFSKKHWKTTEPGTPYPKEETYLFKQLVYRALAEEYIGESKASELLGIALTHFHKERKLGESGETTH